MTHKMKIFELRHRDNEQEWVAADTNIGALRFYCQHFELSIDDFVVGDEIVELPEREWSKHTVINPDYDENDQEDWKEKTFEQYMKDVQSPEIIAGTMYF